MKTFNLKALFTLFAVVLLFTACAEVTPIDACKTGTTYGFLGGLWHGVIAPFSFIISLFDKDVAMYAVNNTGNWYNFGFVVGAGILFGGGGSRIKK
jgi:hypothetical protein